MPRSVIVVVPAAPIFIAAPIIVAAADAEEYGGGSPAYERRANHIFAGRRDFPFAIGKARGPLQGEVSDTTTTVPSSLTSTVQPSG